MTTKIKYPKEGTKYWYIDSFVGEVGLYQARWSGDDDEILHMLFGNFFLKKKDALSALNKIKKILKK